MKPLARTWSQVVRYFQGVGSEFRQVTWPTRPQVVQFTVLVTLTIIASTVVLTVFDYGMQQLVSKVIG